MPMPTDPLARQKRGPAKGAKHTNALNLSIREKRIIVGALGYYKHLIRRSEAVNAIEATIQEVHELSSKVIDSF